MSDINLLPQDLRQREAREQAKPVPPQPKAGFSQSTSELEERLVELRMKQPSFWQRLVDWFNSMPEPVSHHREVVPTPSPRERSVPKSPRRFSWETWFGRREKIVAPPRPSQPPHRPSSPPPIGVQSARSVPPRDVPVGVVLDVNLLPVESRPLPETDSYTWKLVVMVAVPLLLLGAVYAVLSLTVASRETRLRQLQVEATSIGNQVAELAPRLEQVEVAGRKVKMVRDLLNRQHDWLKFFSKLEELTVVTVSFSSISATSSGGLVLSVDASTVSDIARQLRSFEEATDIFSKVVVGSLAASESESGATSVTTTFQLQLTPGWLETVSQ